MHPLLRTLAITTALSLAASVASAAPKAQAGSIAVTVEGIRAGQPIPEAQALCRPTADGTSSMSLQPKRPTIRWSNPPKNTASLAVFMMDPDVPADFTDAGKEGKTLAESAKRQDFFHYGLINLPADAREVAGGPSSSKPLYGTELVNDLGINGYVEPKGAYGGPCPPWNDKRVHNYHFIVLALDKDAPAEIPCANDSANPADFCNTAKNTFTRLMASKHVLAHGTTIGTYTLNKSLRTSGK